MVKTGVNNYDAFSELTLHTQEVELPPKLPEELSVSHSALSNSL